MKNNNIINWFRTPTGSYTLTGVLVAVCGVILYSLFFKDQEQIIYENEADKGAGVDVGVRDTVFKKKTSTYYVTKKGGEKKMMKEDDFFAFKNNIDALKKAVDSVETVEVNPYDYDHIVDSIAKENLRIENLRNKSRGGSSKRVSSKKKKIQKKEEIDTVLRQLERKKPLTFKEKLILSRQGNNSNNTPVKEKKVIESVEFLAVINDNQVAYNNAMITVRVLADVTYNNVVLKRNTFLYGVARIEDSRVKIRFSNMTQGNKRVSINLTAYDQLDGYEGLIISDESVLADINEEASDEAHDNIPTGTGVTGVVGGIISNAISRKKSKIKIKIDLYDEHAIILKGTL